MLIFVARILDETNVYLLDEQSHKIWNQELNESHLLSFYSSFLLAGNGWQISTEFQCRCGCWKAITAAAEGNILDSSFRVAAKGVCYLFPDVYYSLIGCSSLGESAI